MTVAPPEGSLADRDFPALVKRLYEGEWTGNVLLTHMGVRKGIVFQGGRMVFASSTSRDDRLGDVLLRQGKITLHQYVDAGRAVGGGKRLGTILVEKGALSPKDLVTGVVEQTREIIFGVFQWTEGRFELNEGPAGAETITLKISTPELVMEGIRRIESWSRIESAVGGLEARYALTPRGNDVTSLVPLSLEKLNLVTGLSGIKTVDDICSDSSLSHFEVCRTLWAFQTIGVVRRVLPASVALEAEDEGLGSVLAQE